MELDIFLPLEKLAFEYQGEHHYGNVYGAGMGNYGEMKQRDEEKIEACSEAGITLVEVPYWWDKQPSSLAASIYQLRKDLVLKCKVDEKPIPLMPYGGHSSSKIGMIPV